MSRSRRVLAIVLALLVAPALAPAAAESSPDCDVRDVPDVGPACLRADGLLEVFDAAGASLGFTHGPDPVPAADDSSFVDAARDPICVQGAFGDHYTHVIYAHPADRPSLHLTKASGIRQLVRNSNGLVHDAGIATGAPSDLRVLCDGATITVSEAHLPTPSVNARFSTIVSDLRTLGYSDPKVKYWVFYDDTSACSCGGQGNVNGDDRASVDNRNNGNSGSPMYAINYGYLGSTRIWLHELGHNLGAVQNSAPRSTGGFHCIDGRDTMCYRDGGPRGNEYSTAYCAIEVWDCGKDDYFNANPAPGSYLATRWNVAASYNRYLRTGHDTTPPALALDAPARGTVYRGCSDATPLPVDANPVFVRTGCVVVTASDAGAGVARIAVLLDGRTVSAVVDPDPASGTYMLQFGIVVPAPAGKLVVEAQDAAGNAAHVALDVHAV